MTEIKPELQELFAEVTARYEAQYRKFQKIYPALKPIFPIIR